MRKRFEHVGKRMLSALLSVLLLLSLLPFGVAQESVGISDGQEDAPTPKGENTEEIQEDTAMHALQTVCNQLMAVGFPRSYAERLAPLQLAHPSWRFEALFVPEDWQYVLSMEVDDNPARNLISAGAAYVGYRHPENTALYDTGWYQASRETVMYFMDPRNFFNETDIFQFYRFSGTEVEGADMLLAVETVLRGTFMQDCVLENGKTYAENFIEIGNALSISPLYLAVKARQEQGVYGGFTSTGDAGQLLTRWLAAGEQGSEGYDAASLATLDGYYNIFNISASGTGKFRVLYGAMQRAIQGTPSMAEAWGGAAWDAVWKSIYGGAETVTSRYTSNDQDTLYLQKFNVSPAATRRFWGQYMQNVMGALSEGRSLFGAFDAAGAVDGACTFRIPVYSGIGEQPHTDPCGGSSPYAGVATATLSWQGRIAANECVAAFDDSAATLAVSVAAEQSIAFSGSAWGNVPVDRVDIVPVMKNGELMGGGKAVTLYERAEGDSQASFLTLMSLPDYVAVGDELVYCVSLRLGASESYRCRSVSVALIAVQVTAPEAVFVSTCGADGLLYEECVTVGADYTLPQAAACDGEAQFVGWWVQGTAEDGLYPAGATITIGTSAVVLTAAYVHLRVLPGAAVVEKDGAPALRFDGAIRLEDYERLTAITTVELGMLAVPVGEQPHFTDVVCDTIRPSRGEAYLVVCGQTDALAGENLTRNFYGTIGLRVQYADGGECVLTAVRDEESGVRCLRDVARAALADSDAMYAPTLRTLLQNIVQ